MWMALTSKFSTSRVAKHGMPSCLRNATANLQMFSPEWNRTDAQITGPGENYYWESSWSFGNL
jgi:hypothetical protein